MRKQEKIIKLLQALAWQFTKQISYSEIGNLVGLDCKTVEKYIEILEQAFVVFRLPSFSKNDRNELKFSKKVYFYDNGIRNILINNFLGLESRNDVGELWENYLMSERLKKNSYELNLKKIFFYRTKTQKEIDLIETYDDKIDAFEFKFSSKNKNIKAPESFTTNYPESKFLVIDQENYEEFLS